MKRKHFILGTVLISAVLAIIVGWLVVFGSIKKQPEVISVTIPELISNPSLYNGRLIKTSGFGVFGFEANALGDSLERRNDAVYLKEPAIWLEGQEVVIAKQNCFSEDFLPPATFCEVSVEGIFEYGGNYGHLGQYRYQIRSFKETQRKLTPREDKRGESEPITQPISTGEEAIAAVKQRYKEVRYIQKTQARIGQSMNIHSKETTVGWKILFWEGSGDCEAGCLNNHEWYFVVKKSGQIEKLGESERVYNPGKNGYDEKGVYLPYFLDEKICETDKEYEVTAVNPLGCQCPSGYKLATISMGWGLCPQPGARDCPSRIVKCVKE